MAGSVKKTYQGHRNEKFAIGGCFAVLNGESLIVSASEDGGIVLWDVKSKDVIQRVQGHKGVCFWVDVHGDTMVSCGQDNTIRVYRNKNGSGNTNGAIEDGKLGGEKFKGGLPIRQEDIKLEDA